MDQRSDYGQNKLMSTDGITTQLYRAYDAQGKLLYVGISLSAVDRAVQHRGGSAWFSILAKLTVENYPDRASALAAEEFAIKTERPAYNVIHNPVKPRTLENTKPTMRRLRVQHGHRLAGEIVTKRKAVEFNGIYGPLPNSKFWQKEDVRMRDFSHDDQIAIVESCQRLGIKAPEKETPNYFVLSNGSQKRVKFESY